MKALACCGGGCFGISQAKILDKVDTTKFDFFTGTSIGAANAAICALELDIDMTSFFHNEMPKIFKGYWFRRFRPVAPRYSDKYLNTALIKIFDGFQLGDVKKPLFITAINIHTKRLKVFDSTDPSDASLPLWEVLRSATAAETYINPWNGMSDGGVLANDPSMVAIAAGCDRLNIDIKQLELCTIGTGTENSNNKLNALRTRSLISWALWLLKALLHGASSSMHEYFARALPLKKYTKIEFIRNSKWDMDNPKDMLKAELAWEDDIENAIKVVNEF
tara:strand:- start:249 stop:1079 length:831 start_codon:yes stop_codon:yes gene_type:complete